MSNPISRRGIFFMGIPLQVLAAKTESNEFLPLEDPALVREMVGVSHSNLKRVRELLELKPGLVRASIDWGFGDWETALGAASHVGNRDIAELLLAGGAEPTIHSAAMLGHLEVVQAMVMAMPGVQRQYGPHGITLLAHAKAGGEKAAAVTSYLTELGDAGTPLPSQPVTAEERDSLVGRYEFGSGASDYFEVDVQKNQLGIKRAGGPERRMLIHSGSLVFFPSGAPWAKIAFQREGAVVSGFTLRSVGAGLSAKRV